jgi:hypothetical protein
MTDAPKMFVVDPCDCCGDRVSRNLRSGDGLWRYNARMRHGRESYMLQLFCCEREVVQFKERFDKEAKLNGVDVRSYLSEADKTQIAFDIQHQKNWLKCDFGYILNRVCNHFMTCTDAKRIRGQTSCVRCEDVCKFCADLTWFPYPAVDTDNFYVHKLAFVCKYCSEPFALYGE